MRDTITPLQMAKWQAFREIQHDAQERICEILKRGLCSIANVMGGKFEPDMFEPCSDKYQPEPVASPDQAAAIATMALGPPPDGNSNR